EEGGQAAWLQGLRWLLEHGADPNVTSYAKAETPLHSVAAAFPANPNSARADGRTPYALARRCGNDEVAALLLEHGAAAGPLAPADELFAACLAGERDAARAILAARP